MIRTITVPLTSEGLNRAAGWLENYANRTLPKNVVKLVSHMTRVGETWAINLMGHIETGETLSTIVGHRYGNKGVIVAGGAAIWLEFGTGVTKNSTLHPKAAELGIEPWGMYGEGHGLDPSGWWYEKNGEWHHTYGIPANRFMYNTAQMLKKQYPEMAKEIFK